MDINDIMDVIFGYVYPDTPTHERFIVSKMLQVSGIATDRARIKIICDKIKELPFFDIQNTGTMVYDLIIIPNSAGYELVQKYGRYTNYISSLESERLEAKRIAERSANGSRFSGIGAMVAIPLSVLALWFSYANYRKDDNQAQINAALTDSLTKLKTEVRLLSKSMNKHSLPPAKSQTSGDSKKK